MPKFDEEAKGVDKEIYQVGSDFFSQSRAKSGETIYLRMELITKKINLILINILSRFATIVWQEEIIGLGY